LREYCSTTLGDFKAPKQVFFVREIPKNDRGKVRRDALRERWQREHGGAELMRAERLGGLHPIQLGR
jgi:acyl-coenzyme A synthetase/AMP-(fatty) acid ligase